MPSATQGEGLIEVTRGRKKRKAGKSLICFQAAYKPALPGPFRNDNTSQTKYKELNSSDNQWRQ